MPLSGGQNQRKRGGEIITPLQKGKRKRSETPPPSRRPVGAPNTPPPKAKLDENERRNNELLRLIPDHKGVLKDLTGSLDKLNSLENDGSKNNENHIKKPSSNVVSKQLRKLQQMHRNKKETVDLLPDKLDDISDLDAQSPILSILRTSLEEPDDRDNDEISKINETGSTLVVDDNLYDDDDDNNSNDSRSTSTPISNVVTPVSAILSPLLMEDMFRNMPVEQLKNIYRELHTRKVVKARLALWQAVRDRKGMNFQSFFQSLKIGVRENFYFKDNFFSFFNFFYAIEICYI